MAKRRIHLTESQLYGLVEQALNELDWKTYMNAAEKRIAQGNDAYDEPGVDYYKRKDRGNVLYSKADALARHATKALTDKHGVDTEENGWVLFPKGIANKHPMMAGKHSRKAPYRKSSLLANGEEVDGGSSFERYDSEEPDVRDVVNYQKGRSRYIPGKGWNESIARRINENINGYEDWECVLDYIESDGKLRETIDWVIQACVKKAKRGVVLDREHLANCYTLRRLCQIGVKELSVYCDQRLYLSNEDKRKVREELADFILSYVNNEIESQNESVAHRVTESVMRKLRRM